MPKRIRIGLINCDGHAYTYAPLIAPVDMDAYRRNFHPEYYWMIDAYRPTEVKHPRVPGFENDNSHDERPLRAKGVRELLFNKPRICTKLEQVAEGADAIFLCECDGDGSNHLERARPFLKRGLPVFIDKPFANDSKDAKAIVRLARRHNAPLYSASILREVSEIDHLKARLAEIKGLRPKPRLAMGVVKGFGGHLAAVIHGLSLAQGVFGPGVESVDCLGDRELDHVLLHYKDGKQVTVLNAPASCSDWFTCDVWTDPGKYMNPPIKCHLRSNTIGDTEYIGGALNILRKFKRMIRTRKPPIPYPDLIELIATVDAARLAQKSHKRIPLSRVV